MSLHRALIGACMLATTLLKTAGAAESAFDAKQAAELEAVIQRAVVNALRHPTVGDGDPATQPPATVIWSDEVPALNERQRAELGQMVDAAIRATLYSDTTSPADSIASSATANAASDGGLPPLDLTEERLKQNVDAEQGFPQAEAERALLTSGGTARAALHLTETGLNSDPTSSATSNAQIVASNEGARASLKLDWSGGAGDSNGAGAYWSRSLVFSAPVDKNDQMGTSLVGVDGLTNNFELTFNASRIRTEPLGNRPKDGRPLLFTMRDDCILLGIPTDECELSALLRVADIRGRDAADPRSSDAQRIAKDYVIPSAWVQGFRFKAGYDDFKFFDPMSLAKRTQDEVPWGVGVFFGKLSGSSYYAAGLDYQRTYKAADAATVCPAPQADAPLTHCVDGPIGTPSSKEKHLATIEGRWLLGERAVSAKVVHDFKNDIWGVDLPIYLFPNKDGLLSGGLRFGWTDTDKFSAGIFVGVPFDFVKR